MGSEKKIFPTYGASLHIQRRDKFSYKSYVKDSVFC